MFKLARMFRALLVSVCVVLAVSAASENGAAAEGVALPTSEVRIHVALTGNDSRTGELSATEAGASNGPVRTLARAQVLARAQSAAMAGGKPHLPIRVLISAGTYYLDSPLVFTAADSGTVDAPVSYEAATSGTVTLSGGVPLVQRSAARGGAPAVFDLPAVARGTWQGGGQLFVGGEWATLAREPKVGKYWFVQRTVPLDSEPAAESGREAFIPSPEAAAWIAKLSAAERSRAIVELMHSWTSSQHHLSDAAAPAGTLRITPRARWAFLSTGTSQRFFIENVPSALNAPGEWVATDAEIRYLPTEAQSSKPIEAVLPVLEQLVSVRGEAEGGRWAQYLAFKGLSFAHTRQLTGATGSTDTQAAVEVGAAFEVDAAQHITIEHCSFSNTAGYGIWLRKSVRDSRITQSDFNHMGAGGIKIGVAKEKLDEPAPTDRNSADHNRISNTGLLFPGAVGIWLGQGHDNVVANNLIHDTSYTGISVGWSWAFTPAASGNHRILNNLLVNIGSGQLSDMGGIYTLGDLSGTVVSGNVIRDVRVYPGYGPGRGQGGWGIYNDLGSSNVVVENNVVLGTDSGAYHLNGGRQLTVRQNLFASGAASGEVHVSRRSGSTPQAKLDSNIIIARAGQAFTGLAGAQELAFSGNKVAGTQANAALDPAKCGTGCTVSKASYSADADAKAIRFQGLDAADGARLAQVIAAAGPDQGIAPAAKLSVAIKQPALAVVAPPLALPLDLHSGPTGSQPAGLNYRPVGDKQAIKLVDMASAPGGRCLQFNDTSTMTYRYEPYAFATLNHETGAETVEFALLIDADTNFLHEWRDDDRPYHVGPSVRLTAAGIVVGGKVVAPVSVGQWLRVKVSSALGTPGATWQLELRGADGKTVTLPNLKPISPQWQALNSLLYISDAATTSSLCVADLTITNAAVKN